MSVEERASDVAGRVPSKQDTPGIVYLSRIPPTMTLHELRGYFEPLGRVGRIYLAPDEKSAKGGKAGRPGTPRDRRKTRFTEGWVEFVRRRDAKTVALALNGTKIGGKKSNRLHEDIWNIKYLKGFSWSNLTEQSRYESSVRRQKLLAEVSQARKINSQYIIQSERAREQEKIEETRASRQAKASGAPEPPSRTIDAKLGEQMQVLQRKFKQRRPILSET